jgi:K(+)-stimulated pyrophosphate-energized sodium pump
MDIVLISLVSGILALVVAGFFSLYVLHQDPGTNKMVEIAEAIKEGATAFMKREYGVLSYFVLIIAVILGFLPGLGWQASLAFIFGAISSALAGYIGMSIAVRSNNRTAAAVQKSMNKGLKLAFRGGAVMGMSVVGIGILGVGILYLIFNGQANFLVIIPAYGMGASGVALFARVGGGIYTKAADIGADLVGKVEENIPEDDPRNAAVIADLVGDNVGDCAGAGADLFESYVGSIIASMTLSAVAAAALAVGGNVLVPNQQVAWYLPLLVAAGGIVASIIGIFMVSTGEKSEMNVLLNALRRGTYTASVLAAIFAYLAVWFLKVDIGVFWAILVGIITGVVIGEATNYFTSYTYKPTFKVAEAAQTGAVNVLVRGFANGLMSTLPAVILVAIAVIIANHFAGMYGVAISAVGMLATLGITDATEAYGPVADNAGGIAEMSGLPPDVREKTDALDALGNTTKATGKGFAVGSAALTALALILAYTTAARINISDISLLNAKVISGLFIGAMLPLIFVSMTLTAVSETAFSIVNEVRRQFREIKGLMEGTARPEYSRCVDICTKASIKAMILPGIISVVAPAVVGILLGPLALGGFLAGATVTGFTMGVTLSNAGGSWDNAKKFVEAGNFGGKGSEAHKAAVIGDGVGDPFKDTSGPSLNIMVKLMSIVALVLAPVLTNFPGLF